MAAQVKRGGRVVVGAARIILPLCPLPPREL
jgi:hypothetical protein